MNSNIMQTSKNKTFLESMKSFAEYIKQLVYVLSQSLIYGKLQYDNRSLMIVFSSKGK